MLIACTQHVSPWNNGQVSLQPWKTVSLLVLVAHYKGFELSKFRVSFLLLQPPVTLGITLWELGHQELGKEIPVLLLVLLQWVMKLLFHPCCVFCLCLRNCSKLTLVCWASKILDSAKFLADEGRKRNLDKIKSMSYLGRRKRNFFILDILET